MDQTFPCFSWKLTLLFSRCQDCGPSLGLAAGIPCLVATALLVALLWTLIHRRRGSTESTEVISSFFGSGRAGRNMSVNWILGKECQDSCLFSEDKMVEIPVPRFLSQIHDIMLQAELIRHVQPQLTWNP